MARLSPYLTAHVNRFGHYTLNVQRQVPPPDYTLNLQPRAAEGGEQMWPNFAQWVAIYLSETWS